MVFSFLHRKCHPLRRCIKKLLANSVILQFFIWQEENICCSISWVYLTKTMFLNFSHKVIDFFVWTSFRNLKFFLERGEIRLLAVYINVLLKLICYEIWWGKLGKYYFFLFFLSLAILNWTILLKIIKQVATFLKCILLWRDCHYVL